MACTHQGTCPLQTHIGMTAALRVWQSFYCEGSYTRCERYKLLEVGRAVPPDLLPNGRFGDPGEARGSGEGGQAA
jgi:hypothetical protein